MHKEREVRRLTILLAALGALLLIPAAQALAAPTIEVSIEGTGNGEVSSVGGAFLSGEGEGTPSIECAYETPGPATGVCENTMELFGSAYEEMLHAVAAPGSEYIGMEVKGLVGADTQNYCESWEEVGSYEEWVEFNGGPGCFITVVKAHETAHIEVTATFECEVPGTCETPKGPPLTLNIEEGSGSVVSNPAGLECTGEAPKSCKTEAIAEGSVTLTASPAPGYLFKGWKSCDTGGVNGRQCTINLNTAKTVGAKFVKVFSLEGSKSGGPGIMSTSPGGINCGYACSSSTALYKEGSLTVKAKAAKHFHLVEFTNGTGSAASCNGVEAESCTFTITANSAVEELYAEDAKSTLSLSKEGGGQGFVKTSPTNINCGYTCTEAVASFYASESAAVTVTLGKGTSSVTWVSGAGTCTGNALTCSVPMSSSHSLVAKFE
jgi:hypothetical protein